MQDDDFEESPRTEYEVETFWQQHRTKIIVLTVCIVGALAAWPLIRESLDMKTIVDCRRIEAALKLAPKDSISTIMKREPDEIVPPPPNTTYRYYAANLGYDVWDSYVDKKATTIDIRIDNEDRVLAIDYQH